MTKEERFILKIVGWKYVVNEQKELDACKNCLPTKPCDFHNEKYWDIRQMREDLIHMK